MKGASLKLSCLLLVLLAFASFLSPFTVEASDKHTNYKNCNHRGRRPPVSPPQAPTLAPAPAPAPDVGAAPYQIHGCGYPCSDSNDCDWPCTVCGANNTCSHDEPFVPPSPSVEAPAPAPYPVRGGCDWPCSDSNDCDAPCTVCGVNNVCVYEEVCGYPCETSNDCIIEPCVECCNECCPDKLCCKKQAWPPMF